MRTDVGRLPIRDGYKDFHTRNPYLSTSVYDGALLGADMLVSPHELELQQHLIMIIQGARH